MKQTAFGCFHPVTAEWFRAVFDAPTAPQRLGWPVIARRESALILAPTGTGKTLTAFLWCLDRLMLHDVDNEKKKGCRIVYVSPLKALGSRRRAQPSLPAGRHRQPGPPQRGTVP